MAGLMLQEAVELNSASPGPCGFDGESPGKGKRWKRMFQRKLIFHHKDIFR